MDKPKEGGGVKIDIPQPKLPIHVSAIQGPRFFPVLTGPLAPIVINETVNMAGIGGPFHFDKEVCLYQDIRVNLSRKLGIPDNLYPPLPDLAKETGTRNIDSTHAAPPRVDFHDFVDQQQGLPCPRREVMQFIKQIWAANRGEADPIVSEYAEVVPVSQSCLLKKVGQGRSA